MLSHHKIILWKGMPKYIQQIPETIHPNGTFYMQAFSGLNNFNMIKRRFPLVLVT